jgi:S-phase kinase-associated protein 1
MATIIVKTSEGQEHKVDIRITKVSRLFKEISEGGSDVIPLDIVDAAVFNKVVEYCQIHDYQPIAVDKPIKSKNIQDNLKEKDFKFIQNYTLETVKPLLNAAYYLGMDSLRDVCLILIASEFFIGESIEDIQRIKDKFQIEGDMTPQEEEEIKKDYPWAVEDDVAEELISMPKNEIMIIEEESKV